MARVPLKDDKDRNKAVVRTAKGPDLNVRRPREEEEERVTVWKGSGGGKEEAPRTTLKAAAS